MSLLPKNRSLFAERVTLKLIELSRSYLGIKALNHLERARRFNSVFGMYADSSVGLASKIDSLEVDDLENDLLDLFWLHAGQHVRMPDSLSRICLDLPDSVQPASLNCFEVGVRRASRDGVERISLDTLNSCRYKIKGETKGFADDVALFDLAELEQFSSFITVGTTVSFYFPSAIHSEWYVWARMPRQLPPEFKIDKKLVLIANTQITPDVNCAVFGADVAASLKAP